jgi:ribosome biogenesis GTPase
MPGARVDIRNVWKSFELGGRVIEVLRGVDLVLEPGQMVAVVGSSGAGKSTLVNRLLGVARQSTAGLGVDGRGAHTTTHRELLVVPGGGLVVDTPGMRELRMWDADVGLDEAFADVTELAARCRFGDCAHEGEPGCAVRAAIDDGGLPFERWRSWDKLQRENAAFAERKDARVAAEARRKRKVFARAARLRDRSKR